MSTNASIFESCQSRSDNKVFLEPYMEVISPFLVKNDDLGVIRLIIIIILALLYGNC